MRASLCLCFLCCASSTASAFGSEAGEPCSASDESCPSESSNDTTALLQAPKRQKAVKPDAANATGAAPRKKVFLMHVAKTSGVSAATDLPRHIGKGTIFGSSECCWPNEGDGWEVVTFVREPLSHVYSQWHHCEKNLDNWFKPEGLPGSFAEWLEYWARVGDKPGSGGTGFHCYIPINLQARVLSCHGHKCPYATSAFDRNVKNDTSGEFAVNTELAMQRVVNASVGASTVGLTEFYRESMCLIHVRHTGSFPSYCNCEDEKAWSKFPITFVTHGSGHRHVELSQHEVDLVNRLTDVDRRIYSAAHARFMAEIAEVEKRFGKKILCRNATLPQEGQPEARTVLLQWDHM